MNLSPRLKRLYDYMMDNSITGVTTIDIQRDCRTCAPGSDAADLRKVGIPVECAYQGRSREGRKIYRYWLGVTA